MLFIDWRLLQIIAVGGLLILALTWLSRWGQKRQPITRIPIQVFSISIALVSVFLLLLITASAVGCQGHEIPVYSPDGTRAARIESFDGGALGGDTVVRLYEHHGFDTAVVFYGGWKSVERQNLSWRGNTELRIRYFGEAAECKGDADIRVVCTASHDH